MLREIPFTFALVICALVPAMVHNLTAAEATNLIIILCDDLGYGDVEGFGDDSERAPTPNIDRLGNEGARLTRFYAPTPYCAPSRASLLTGRYPYHNGVFQNPAPDAGLNSFGMPHEEETLAELFDDAGYNTAHIGKWHLGHTSEFLPTRHGFDEYFGILYSNDMRPVQLVENERVAEYPVAQSTLTDRYTERSIDFISRSVRENKPFFLYLAHAMPHKPLAASEEFWTLETPDDLYHDVIRELDYSVGRILIELGKLGVERNTLVLFLSDNGPWYGGNSGGLRGMKGTTWEGGLRVPFIAWQPGVIPAGIENDGLSAMVDILPTAVNHYGLKRDTTIDIDGHDLMPLLTRRGAVSQHEAIFGMQGETIRTVTTQEWRLHVVEPNNRGLTFDITKDPRRPDGVTIIAQPEQAREFPGVFYGDMSKDMMLFNLIEDPAEQNDLSSKHPEMIERLYSLYKAEAATAVEMERVNSWGGVRLIKGGDFSYEKISDHEF